MDDTTENSEKPDTSIINVQSVAVKLPEFILKDPELWLIQAESQFILSNVTREETQYHHIVSCLPQNVLFNCRDIVKNRYQRGSLQLLKKALIDRYSLSTEQRIKEVLDNCQYTPPELPSAFFRRLWATADGVIGYDVVIARFRERLPPSIANAIAPITNQICDQFKATQVRPLTEESTMLAVADLIAPNANVSAVNKPQRHQRRSSNRRSRSTSRGRSPSPNNYRDNGNWCRNHFLYGKNCYNCSRPNSCTFRNDFARNSPFSSNNNNNNSKNQ